MYRPAVAPPLARAGSDWTAKGAMAAAVIMIWLRASRRLDVVGVESDGLLKVYPNEVKHPIRNTPATEKIAFIMRFFPSKLL